MITTPSAARRRAWRSTFSGSSMASPNVLAAGSPGAQAVICFVGGAAKMALAFASCCRRPHRSRCDNNATEGCRAGA